MNRTMVTLVAAFGLWAQVAHAARTDTEAESCWTQGGYGVVSVLANLLYMPTKVVYAGLGAITGGLAYVLTVGDEDVADAVWNRSVGGTYVVTPAMVRGDEDVFFFGEHSAD